MWHLILGYDGKYDNEIDGVETGNPSESATMDTERVYRIVKTRAEKEAVMFLEF